MPSSHIDSAIGIILESSTTVICYVTLQYVDMLCYGDSYVMFLRYLTLLSHATFNSLCYVMLCYVVKL